MATTMIQANQFVCKTLSTALSANITRPSSVLLPLNKTKFQSTVRPIRARQVFPVRALEDEEVSGGGVAVAVEEEKPLSGTESLKKALMLEKLLGVERSRKFHRALRHTKTSLLCFLLTLLVLRGTIGAGNYGTPEQDFNQLRLKLHFPPKRVVPHRPDPNTNINNNNPYNKKPRVLLVTASSETRAEIVELITQLEAENPTPAPTEALPLLNGKWILV
ncbi:hypothetical protein ACFE04_029081 [Oxalis oulophora]